MLDGIAAGTRLSASAARGPAVYAFILVAATEKADAYSPMASPGLRGSQPHRTGGLPATRRVLFYYIAGFDILRVAISRFGGAIFDNQLKGVIFVGASTNAQPIGVHDPSMADFLDYVFSHCRAPVGTAPARRITPD
jgi:hypothetical protein